MIKKQPRPKREREPQPNPVPCPEIETTLIKNHRILDMRGKNIHHLTVYAFSHHTEGRVYWKCWCDCGTLCEVSAYALQNNKRKSCGCLNPVGRKGDAALRKSIKKRHTIIKRMRAGVPIQDPPIIVDGDPAVAFAHDALLSYACLQWANYEPATHHRLIAQYLERVERGEIKRLMITVPPRHGKECAHSTPVLTMDGWKTHGELKVGDFVFHPSGNPVEVLAESISSGDMFETHQDDFLVKTTSGETIRCHARHEWRVFDRLMHQWRVVETQYLFSQPPGHGPVGKRGYHYRFKLPDTSSVLFDHADLPLDPYFLGVWLGDGTSTGSDFVYHPKDREPREEIERRGFVVTSENTHATTGVVSVGFGWQGIRQTLRELRILGEKNIPEIYLRSSLDQRLDLLAGLIDTDGHVERSTGRVRISTVSVILKDAIVDLLTGLGQRPYVTEQQPCTSSSGIVGKRPVFYIGFQPTLDIPTKIPRKQIDWIAIDRRRLAITEVIYQPNGEQGKCIQVDSPDGLYLVGRTLIPTHNSMLLSEYFPAWYLGRNPDKRVIAASYGQDLASDFGRKVRNQIADPLFQEIFPDVKLAEDSAAVDKFNLAHPKTGGYFAVGVGGALTGRGANCLPGDTKILTSHGIIYISDILRYNSPVMALSFSEKNNAFVWSPIVAVSRRKSHELVRVVTNRGSITCTPEHPFYIAGVGYIEAQSLTAGQNILAYEMLEIPEGVYEGSKGNGVCEETGKDGNMVLLKGMCRQGSFNKNDGREQLELSRRNGNRSRYIKEDDTGDSSERWVAVCGLPCNGDSSYPSYRPESSKQCNGEYGDYLPFLPHEGSQVGTAIICMVEPVYNDLVEVYDIEVFEHHNFVALTDQGTPLVVKNCLIVDDPIKSREISDSESSRRKLKDWYTSVAYTRLMDSGSIIVCQTRWQLEDLAGWLLKEHRHENWIHLDLPAINEKGEALWPERYPIEELEKIRRTLPARDWEALYQQKPFVEEGEIFRRGWWKKWPDSKPLPECSYIIQSWDTAYTEQDIKANSFSARTTWGVFQHADEDYANVILLERWKGQVDYSALRKEALAAYREYSPDKIIIEKKSSGISLVQDLRKAGLPIHAFNPEHDKIARAYRAQSLFENGRVYYPDRKWAEDVIDEMCTFRPGNPNDTADTISQAFIWLTNSWLVRNSADVDAEKEEELPSNVKRLKPRKAAYG